MRHVGLDRKVADSLWLGFRLGGSRTADGIRLENKALFSLKFLPESTVDRQVR